MKKHIIILSVFMFTSLMCLKAQGSLELTHRNEMKLNLASTLFLTFPELSYEYILTQDFSVGAAIGLDLQSEKTNFDYKYKFTPFARWFFGDNFGDRINPATGLFLEVSSAVGAQEVKIRHLVGGSKKIWEYNYENKFAAGLCLAMGWKYLSKNNWTTELFLGVGRNFIFYEYEKDDLYDPDPNQVLYPRLGICIGKRF